MANYNYLEAIKEDVRQYIKDEVNLLDFTDRDKLEDALNDDLWTVDSVTGNASGSYTFSRCQAQEYVLNGMDELKEALDEYGTDSETIADKFINEDWEWFDVIIRCYLLGQAIAETLDEMEDELEEAFEC